MRCLLILSIMLASSLCTGGCTPTQLATGDKVFADANGVGTVVKVIATNPLVSEPVSTIGLLIGVALTGAYAGWQRVRASGLLAKNQTLTDTAKAIIRAVDTVSPAASAEVKTAVASELDRKDIAAEGRATVTELKAS